MTRTTDRIDGELDTATSRRSALRMIGGGLVGGALAGIGLSAANQAVAQPAGRSPLLSGLPVSGDASNGATFKGTATITSLYTDEAGEALYVSGVLTGTLSDGTELGVFDGEDTTGSFASAGPITLAQAGGSCDIFNLMLGTLDLDVLGLLVEIPDPIVLDIRAERGPGNRLGNLLCAVTRLLDGTGVANADGGLQGLLNRINALLAGV